MRNEDNGQMCRRYKILSETFTSSVDYSFKLACFQPNIREFLSMFTVSHCLLGPLTGGMGGAGASRPLLHLLPVMAGVVEIASGVDGCCVG